MARPIKIVSQNLMHGGVADDSGVADDRRPALIKTIGRQRPHVALIQEAEDWERKPSLAFEFERALGLRALVAPSPSGLNTAVMFDPNVFDPIDWDTGLAGRTRNGFGVAVLAIYGSRTRLVIASAHLDSGSAEAAGIEAQLIQQSAWLHGKQHGELIVVGLDANHLPLGDEEPNWNEPPFDAPWRAAGAEQLPDGTWRSLRTPGKKFLAAGLIDVAAQLAEQRADASLRRPTSGAVRDDQFHISPRLRPALRDYAVIDHHHSDHVTVEITLDGDRLLEL
jgi:hypothetical protein